MKRHVIAGAALAALIGAPAFAADMAAPVYKAPPPPAPAWSWTGFYVGGQIGGAWSNSSYTHNNGAGLIESFSFDPTSAIGGGHVGVQGQWTNWVLGIEGTFNWTDLNQTDPSVLSPPRLRSLKTDDIATVVAKAGYTWGAWMLYAKGGWADAQINVFAINPATGISGGATNWKSGWTAGAGLDYMIVQNVIAGIDFNYYNFKFDGSALDTDGTISSWSNAHSNVYAATARLSNLFGWGR
jgi:outer membrane immunogenic protein